MEESNYRIAYDNEWNFLKEKDPFKVATLKHCQWDPNNVRWTLNFLNEDYEISWKEESILRKSDGENPVIEAAIMMLNYLRHSDKNVGEEQEFVTLKEISGGGALFYPAFYKNSILPLCKTFGENGDALIKAGKALGGNEGSEGDISLVFQLFPLIKLKVILWLGDDELSPAANILFDKRASELMHVESVIGLGMHLSAVLRNEAKEKKEDDESDPVPIFF